MMSLGPMALRACGWQRAHIELCFAAALQAGLDKLAASGAQITARIKQVPPCLRSCQLGLTSEAANGELSLLATLSPISAITLPLLSRFRAGIPLAATHFAYL